ncbi:VirB4 family type IV secretion/conjugal transfer ATPase [Roseitranquillus sediminis]|uniref:VirB4 family type IV secretion/conjugal transfer ATPase n=1 Tax=Roseitranquillus sediminis TaxID=2809051 RepID=UPI001D0C7DF3|nr:hypothetical protein [Roseitranquillus sediminis]MBM9595050.1 hypothetical protein [Roseitranquillus sediminis]
MLETKRGLGRRAVEPAGLTREHMLAAHLPYLSAVSDHVLMLRDGDVMASFIVRGVEAQTADRVLVDDVARAMSATIAQAAADVAFYVHRLSHGTEPAMLPVEGTGFAAQIDRTWQATLRESGLRDRASMVTVIIRPPRLTGLWTKLTGGSKRDLHRERDRRVARLNEVMDNLMQALAATRPERLTLTDGRWLGMLRMALSGKYAPLTPGAFFTPLSNLLADSRVDFRGETFIVFGLDSADMRFGALFSLKKYPTETAPGFLDRLDLPADMVVTHSFTPIELVPALARVQRTSRQMSAADDAARSAQADLVQAADDLASGRISFGHHQATAMVVAKSEAELDALAAEIRTQVQRSGGVAVREDIGARTAYFAQHPGNFAYRARAAMISSACFADFAALHASDRGLEPGTEPWDAPITTLPTVSGEPYRFNFHLPGAPGERTVGHTLVIGRTGSGKTIGTAFLLAQAQRVEPRIIAFDKDRGLEPAIRAFGGSYSAVHMGERTGFNPFRAEADARGTAWLTDWLGALLGGDAGALSAVQAEALAHAAQANADAAPSLQTLAHFRAQLVALDDDSDLYTRMAQWDAEGQYGWLFSGAGEDPLRFANAITAFDLTEIFDSPAVRTAWLSYVFRRVERTVEDGRPTLLVLDEAWKLLDDPYFEARLKDWMLTMRKKNVAVVMLTQRVSHITESRAGGSILESVATQILFPNARNSDAELAPLGLTDAEAAFASMSPAGSRLALVRSGDASAIVDLDLSALGPLLGVLAGDDRAKAEWRGDAPEWKEAG